MRPPSPHSARRDRAIDQLEPELVARSLLPSTILLAWADALRAVDALAARGWALTEWTGRYEHGGELRRESTCFSEAWRAPEPWDTHARRVAEAAKAWVRGWAEEHPAGLVELHATAASGHVEKAEALLARFFAASNVLEVTEGMPEVPLVAARLTRETPLYSAGQKIYVYTVFWGMNERAQVVGRYRRTQRWVLGVCGIHLLEDARPQLACHPAVIAALSGNGISAGIFRGRLWPMPRPEPAPDGSACG